jgi:phosphoribosylaminoimidazolecarboxamide formyltransferase/IMP cyclohydrolase
VRALLAAYDKTGLAAFAGGLADLGWELVATGGTAEVLERAGVPHTDVAGVTGSPEMLGGRVKTLHPRIHAGILADRSVPDHLETLREQGIEPIDLVVCNLYPFAEHPSVETIDIGGPTMVRAAAKNAAHVGVVTSPADYDGVLDELRAAGRLSAETRRRLARAAFAHTAAYDAAIVAWLDGDDPLPPSLHLTYERMELLRYGENPHQPGARYRSGPGWWDEVVQRAGAGLSYLNVFDADAAWRLAHELSDVSNAKPAAVVVKHANPCGAAVAGELAAAYAGALEGDPVAAFGGIAALRGTVTAEVADAITAGPQMDVVVASSFHDAAVERLVARRRATRLLEAPPPEPLGRQVRALGATALVQVPDTSFTKPDEWEVPTSRRPTGDAWEDLVFAWHLCARTASNAVVLVSGGRAVGIGAGQQSRVAAAELAVAKAGERAAGAAAASDAFFPFPDGVEVLARAGVAAVAQPGGSVRDAEVVDAAERAGLAMVMTGRRHFRH